MNREDEIKKYVSAYRGEGYGMGDRRFRAAWTILDDLPCRGGYLDVGCGRGEMLDLADDLGFDPVQGTEVVPDLVTVDGKVVRATIDRLPFPDRSFDVVSCLDVIEHLVPGDDELGCREMARVASRFVVLTISNVSHRFRGVELHVNRRPYDEWDRLLASWFPGTVTRLGDRATPVNQAWLVDLTGR